MAQCQEPGASVAAVALAHGLNINLVRKWLVGRGIKRTGLAAPRTTSNLEPRTDAPPLAALQFVPVKLTSAANGTAASNDGMSADPSDIHIVLSRGGTQLSVRWPSSQAASCAAWLGELVAAALNE
jgi:transposase